MIWDNLGEIRACFGGDVPDFGMVTRIASCESDILERCRRRGVRRVLLDARVDKEWLSNLNETVRILDGYKLKCVLDAGFDRIGKTLPRAKELTCNVQPLFFDREIYIVPPNTVSVTAYVTHDGIPDISTAQDLRELMHGSFLRFSPSRMNMVIVSVSYKEIPDFPDVLDGSTFEEEKRIFWHGLGNFNGSVLINAMDCFSTRPIYSEKLIEQFRRIKGYDPTKYLAALFMDMGNSAKAYVMDYFDVLRTVANEEYFIPKWEWLKRRNIPFLVNSISDNPELDGLNARLNRCKYLFKEGIAADFAAKKESIEQLHARGYDTLCLSRLDSGKNVPEDDNAELLERLSGRISVLMSITGKAQKGYGLLYPYHTTLCNDGKAMASLNEIEKQLEEENIAYSYTDAMLDGEWENYAAVIAPKAEALPEQVLEKVILYLRKGGTVFFAEEPQYGCTERMFKALLKQLITGRYAYNGKNGFLCCTEEGELLQNIRERKDYPVRSSRTVKFLHRTTDKKEWFLLFNVHDGQRIDFRAAGEIEQWDVFTGKSRPLYARKEEKGYTGVLLNGCRDGICVLSFDKEKKGLCVSTKGVCRVLYAEEDGSAVLAAVKKAGEKHAVVALEHKSTLLSASVNEDSKVIGLDGEWDFYLGDGGETTVYVAELKADSGKTVKVNNGVEMLYLGPFNEDTSELEKEISSVRYINGTDEYFTADGSVLNWCEYCYAEQANIVLNGDGKHYLRTYLCASADDEIMLLADVRPNRVYVNGEYCATQRKIKIKQGINSILLRWDGAVQTNVEFRSLLTIDRNAPHGMHSYETDPYPFEDKKTERYVLNIPPFARKMKICAFNEPTVSFEGKECTVLGGRRKGKATEYEIRIEKEMSCGKLDVSIEQCGRLYGGGLFAQPVEFVCTGGELVPETERAHVCLNGCALKRNYVCSVETDVTARRYLFEMDGFDGVARLSINGVFAASVMGRGERTDVTQLLNSGRNVLRLEVFEYGTAPGQTPRIRFITMDEAVLD